LIYTIEKTQIFQLAPTLLDDILQLQRLSSTCTPWAFWLKKDYKQTEEPNSQ
jgi:hypothetical protein